MIGVLVLSHGNFCEQLIKSTIMIAGPLKNTKAVALQEGESPDAFGERVKEAVAELDSGEGVLVLADLFGGTPFNQIGSLSHELHVEIVTGMNLPMLLQVSLEKEQVASLTELADKAKKTGQEAVKIIRNES